MFKSGDTVLYGSDGVCRITEITEKKFGDIAIEYYVLTPVFANSSTFFVPTQNQKLISKMHPILTNDEIMSIIESTDELDEWVQNDVQRKDEFKEIIAGGNIRTIVAMLKSIIRHKDEIEASGKKLHKADETAFKEAQKILYEEFAMEMELTKEEVIDIICGKK